MVGQYNPSITQSLNSLKEQIEQTNIEQPLFPDVSKRTTAINKILALKKRIKIIQGGTSAGKTFGILPILIDKAAKTGGLEISVVAESIPHLRRGALRDFLKVMKWTNSFVDDKL